jgi:hypothetical protein
MFGILGEGGQSQSMDELKRRRAIALQLMGQQEPATDLGSGLANFARGMTAGYIGMNGQQEQPFMPGIGPLARKYKGGPY